MVSFPVLLLALEYGNGHDLKVEGQEIWWQQPALRIIEILNIQGSECHSLLYIIYKPWTVSLYQPMSKTQHMSIRHFKIYLLKCNVVAWVEW